MPLKYILTHRRNTKYKIQAGKKLYKTLLNPNKKKAL